MSWGISRIHELDPSLPENRKRSQEKQAREERTVTVGDVTLASDSALLDSYKKIKKELKTRGLK